MTAWFNGFLGTILTFWLGSRYLGLSPGESFICVLASNIGGLVALVVVLRLETWTAFKTRVFRGAFGTWAAFIFIWLGITLLIASPLRSWASFRVLILPLMLGNGFCILLFGPIQDWIVRRDQRRMKGFPS